eukprot:2391491-Pleurochrysis_carterae.AAC.1
MSQMSKCMLHCILRLSGSAAINAHDKLRSLHAASHLIEVILNAPNNAEMIGKARSWTLVLRQHGTRASRVMSMSGPHPRASFKQSSLINACFLIMVD